MDGSAVGQIELTQESTDILAVILIYAYWFHAEDDEIMNKWARAIVESIEKEANERGLRYPFYFLNDASVEQEPFVTYGGGKSLDRLRQIAEKYDPEHIFQKLVPGFKLGIADRTENMHSEL